MFFLADAPPPPPPIVETRQAGGPAELSPRELEDRAALPGTFRPTPLDSSPVEVGLLTIVGSAGLPPRPADDAFSSVEVGAETISAAPRLDEALTLTPGVQLFRRTSSAAANPTTQGVTVRAVGGSGAGRALVTLDGVPQGDPFGGWVIWSSLPSASVQEAIIVRGAGAGPYGAGALTGVIQLGERREVSSRGEYELFGGQDGVAGGQAVFAIDKLLVVGAAQSSDGWVPVGQGRGAADKPLAFDASSLAVRWSPDLPDDGKLSLRLAGYREARQSGLDGASSRAEGVSASATWSGAFIDALDLTGEWRLQAWARASDFENSSVAVGAGRAFTTPASEQFGTPALGLGFNAAYRGEWSGGGWELGADIRYAEGETRENFRYMAGAFTRGRVAGGAQSVAGVYGEAWWYGQNSLSVTGGLRLDRWASFDGRRLETNLATGAPTLTVHPVDADGLQPTARLGIRKDYGVNFVRAAGYVGFRPPTLNELHRPFRVGNDVTEANAGLEPEKLYGLEIGAGGGGWAEVRWNATLFANRLEGAVTNVTIGFGPGVFPVAGFIPAGGVLRQRQNAGDVDALGLEADISGGAGTDFTWRVAGAWTRAEVDGGSAAPQLTGLRPAQTPEISASAEAVWQATSSLTLRTALRYEGERFDDDLNLRQLSPATTADLRADWRVTGRVDLYAAVENLTDAEVETGQTADGIESFDTGRTIRFGLIWRP